MKKSRLYTIITFLTSLAAIVLMVGLARHALAQVSIDFPGNFAGFSSQDLKTTISNLVRIIVGFLGVIFILLLLYGGLVWMTSQGERDKIDRAKKIIASAVIGLLVTLSAYSIASFIISSLQGAVSPGGGSSAVCGNTIVEPGESCDDGGTIGGDNCSSACQIEFAIPGCTFPVVPGSVKVCSVTNPAFRSQTATIKGYNFGATTGTVTINGVAVAPVACGASNGWSGGTIIVEIPPTMPLGNLSAPGQNVIVTNSGGTSCAAGLCGTTDIQAGSGPFIRCMNPNSGPSDGSVTVTLDGKNFGAAPGSVEMEGAAGPFTVNAIAGNWSDGQIKFIVPAAGNPQQAITGYVTAIDSSANRSNDALFRVTCTIASSTSSECATGCCTTSLQCQPVSACATIGTGGPQAPVITSINPNNGEEGNYVTIFGNNFSTNPPAQLHFRGPNGIDIINSLATCSTNWTNTQIIMRVPDVAPAGPTATNGAAQVWVTTANGNSNQVTFTVNDTVRPGLCSVNPTSGISGTAFTLNGNNFSANQPSGLIAYYTFNNGTATDSAGTNSGTLLGSPVPAGPDPAFPWLGNSFNFLNEPGAAPYDTVEVPHNNVFNFGTGPFSFSAWVKTTDNSGMILSKDPDPSRSFRIEDPGRAKFIVYDSGSSPAMESVTSSILVNDGQFHHLVGVRDATTLYIYVDGVLNNTAPRIGLKTVNYSPPFPLYINSDFAGDSSARLTGIIDDVRIYNRALTSGEVIQVMQAAPSDIYFGQPTQKVSANNQNFTSATAANATVPNIVPTYTTVAVNVDDQDSNPLGFTVQGVDTTAPVVTSVGPNNGPKGTYITIIGNNFGTLPGQAWFVKQDQSAQFAIDTTFPAVCSTNYWNNNRIIAKVPQDGLMLNGNYYLYVQNVQNSKYSQNSYLLNINAFTQNNNALTPGLCRIDPTGGPAGTKVDYFGEGFGTPPGRVFFETNQQSPTIASWQNQQILDADVPAGAKDGDTYVQSSLAANSNGMPFTVGTCTTNAQCGGGSVCCVSEGLCRTSCAGPTNFGQQKWGFTSGEFPFDLNNNLQCTASIQSPTPYPYDQAGSFVATDLMKNAPIDSDIAGTFTRSLDFLTVDSGTPANNTDDNIKVFVCNTGSSFGACTTQVDGTFTPLGSNGWKFHPTILMNSDTWYEVRLDDAAAASSRVAALDGSRYKGTTPLLGPVGTLASFRWHFHTRNASQAKCQPTDVKLNPSAMTVAVNSTSGTMTATPVSSQCYICGGTGYTYSWLINPNPAAPNQYADFTPVPAPTTASTQFRGVKVTTPNVPPYSNVTTTITNPPSGPPITSSVPAQLTVAKVLPRVTRFSPTSQCRQVCTNVLPYAEFNVSLNPATAQAGGAITLNNCGGSSACPFFSGYPASVVLQQVTNPNDRVELITAGPLPSTTWFRVIIHNTVTDTQGQRLDLSVAGAQAFDDPSFNGLNGIDSFSWVFETSNEQCTVELINVLPTPATINTIGGTQNFSVTAGTNYLSSDPSCGPFNLNPNSYDWDWASSDGTVASVTTNGKCSQNAALSCTTNAACGGLPNFCKHFPQQSAKALRTCNPPSGPGCPITIGASIPGNFLAWLTPADLYINDFREPIDMIAWRPDSPPGMTPSDNSDGNCDLGFPWNPGSANPANCLLQCTNVMTSAIFNTYLDASSFTYYTIPSVYAGYYSFNRDSAFDDSGNGNNGLLMPDVANGNAPTFSVPSASAALGKVINFDGLDDYVLVPNNAAFNLANQNLTITFWVKSDSAPASGGRSVISKGRAFNMANGATGGCSTVANMGWEIIQMTDRYRFGSCGNGTFFPADTPLFTTADNQWHFITVAFDRIDQTIQMSVDGRQGAGARQINVNPSGEPNDLCFGSRCGSFFFKGALDDIRIYNHDALALEHPFSDSVLQQILLEGVEKQVPPLNFHLVEYPSGQVIPGSVRVTNYRDTTGICDDGFTFCTTDSQCLAAGTGATTCFSQTDKRGRVDFYPQLGGGSYTIPSDYLAHYSFNDGTGRDSSANGFDGVPSTSPAPRSVGPNTDYPLLNLGMGFLDPTVGASDYMAIGDIPALDIGTGALSIAFWAQSSAPASAFTPPNASIPISKGQPFAGCVAANTGYEIRQFANNYQFMICTGASSGTATSPSFTTTDGQWHHITAVYDRGGTKMTMYLDGVAAPSVTANFGSTNIDTANPLAFGSRFASGVSNHSFNGSLDDIYIYKRQLAASEVDAIYRLSIGQRKINGVYDPSKQYQARVCPGNSCLVKPIKSYQGVPYTSTVYFGFETGPNICRIGLLDIKPNPADFIDRTIECRLPVDAPICKDATPKTLIAQAKDASGIDLSAVTYTWRTTTEYGGPYSSTYYELNQPSAGANDAELRHKGKLGIDYAQVTAQGVDPTDTVTESGRLNFSFCQNPWVGDASNNTYYLDSLYDLKLSYCRDTASGSASNPLSLLPNLPNPHVERNSPGFGVGGDLLKEHVFIVGTNTSGSSSITDQPPTFKPLTFVPAASYKIGDLVNFKLDASDPNGDSFTYRMADEGGADALPPSVSFNQRTGSFTWVIDTLPTTDGPDGDTITDFILTFSLNPAGGGTQTVTLNVQAVAAPATITKPTVRFTSPGNGSTITVDYGQSQIFNATRDALGSTGGTAATSIKSFIWDFQDSGLSSYTGVMDPTFSATHVFLQAGIHQVTFRVQNNLDVWSDPAVVNVNVRAKTSAIDTTVDSTILAAAPRSFMGTLWQSLSSLFAGRAYGQTAPGAPSNVTLASAGDNTNPKIQITWKNTGTYSSIKIYRNSVVLAGASALPGATTSYLDAVTVGTQYTYKVCGIINALERCSADATMTARYADLDVIIARVYKNTNLLPIADWYKAYAPNPTGSPSPVTVDGYDAIKDGTSIYVGMGSCANASSGTCASVYANVLLLSYNLGAKPSTVTIFNQLVANLKINEQLVNRDRNRGVATTCSDDASVVCEPGYDAACAAKNAGLCTSAKAELRRDYKRVVDLHTIVDGLYSYAQQNKFCNDGTNSIACNTDIDCPSGNRCVNVYPSLSSGSYIGGLSTSQWPSWKQTLAKDLKRSDLPHDPINKFGANFYRVPPDSCKQFAGHDLNTCWNERTSQLKCHAGSEVYMYQIKNGINFKLYATAEDPTWVWQNKDPNVTLNDPTFGGICNGVSSVAAVCGNGVIEGTEICDGGSINYCDANFGNKNWNTDFKVGCKSDCTGWGAPAGASVASCNGACGDTTVNAPYEQCEGTVPAGYSCTSSGSVYCSTSCQIACTDGRPYGGQCGDGVVALPEVCDDGANNGQVGYCSASCSGYDTFCGDGALTPILENPLGCQCDSTITASSCSAYPNTTALAGQSCAKTCATGTAHEWSCVQNVEECDTVAGLTSYSCPASSSLYCDSKCNRACTNIDTVANIRQSVAVYEHYFSQAGSEDYDYTILKKADDPYATKSIVFYAYQPSVAGSIPIYRLKASAGVDHKLSTSSSFGGYTSLGIVFYAFNATGANRAPVYEFRIQKATGEVDYYYSRNSTPRVDNQGSPYVIQPSGNPLFYAMIGPFQETCGNDIIEGNETCEPDIFQTPTPANSNVANQYACGAAFTPNACRVYGGYCGDGGHCSVTTTTLCDRDSQCPLNEKCTNGVNTPFEQCDEGTSMRCSNSTTITCTTDANCPVGGTCVGNGAICNNSGTNCTYCSKSCSKAIIPRNYCGDAIVNCGINTPNNCTDANDPYTEVCDDGIANNGKPGYCNETCSGQTGSVCGNNAVEGLCSGDTSISCDPRVSNSCPPSAGQCRGEFCDDGTNNGRWTYTCAGGTNAGTLCTDNPPGQCAGGGTCSGTPIAYCSFSCLELTPAVCGDAIIQQPNAGPDRKAGNGDDVNELCDSGGDNGKAGKCNITCTGITPAVCGDTIVGAGVCSNDSTKFCQQTSDCAGGGTCIGGETCDPPASETIQDCFDTSNPAFVNAQYPQGKSGLRGVQCSSSCQAINTQCHAFGLKIWSDAVDVAYLNGSMMLLDPAQATGSACNADPDLQGTNYSSPASPPSGNSCGATQVRFQSKTAPSDIRPINSTGDLVAQDFEFNGKNVVAIKSWPSNPLATRSFEAVYTSPFARNIFESNTIVGGGWACSNIYTPGWELINCPDNIGKCSNSTNTCTLNSQCGVGTCGPDGKSDCDPTVGANNWRTPVSYSSGPCNTSNQTNYPDFVGGGAKWIWGPTCDPNPDVVYCRFEYQASGVPVMAAWNPNYGWIFMSTAGSKVTIDSTNTLRGAGWNRNLGWLFFDGTPQTAPPAVANPRANQPVTADPTTGQLIGQAWGQNYGLVYFNPKQACGTNGPRACSNNGAQVCSVDADCGGAPNTCSPIDCTNGFGGRAYQGVVRNPSNGTTSGYAWSEQAGWIDFGAYTRNSIIIPLK